MSEEATVTEMPKKERKIKKAAAPVRFYALVEADLESHDGEKTRGKFEIEADKKSVLFLSLEKMGNPIVLMLVRGRKITLFQRVAYKI